MTAKTKWLIAGGVVLLLLLSGLLQKLVAGLAVLLAPLALIGGIVWVFWFFLTLEGRRKKLQTEAKNATVAKLMAQFGETPEAQIAAINKAFDERTQSVAFMLDYHGLKPRQLLRCHMERSLATMQVRDREALRSVLLLKATGLNYDDNNVWIQALGIIYGSGKATIFNGHVYTWPGYEIKGINEGVKWLIGGDDVESCVNLAVKELSDAIKKHPDNPVLRPLAARLLGNGSDLDPPESLATAEPGAVPGDFLIIGGKDNKLYGFQGEGALITVAPPGSGKTQCHVIPNLLTWDGPAVVLDVKGEIFEKTSGWRAANVGPVFKFSPLSKEGTHRYNPLAEVSTDPDHLWEDSRFLADMLSVPGGKDPFWESRARDITTAAIAYVVDSNPEIKDRTMGKVLNILHGVKWDGFIIGLEASSIETMARAGASLGGMEPKTRDGVLQSALASLSAWEGNRITRATAATDWRPQDLRDGKNSTLYICVNPNEIDSYASLLRVVIAQHIRALTASLPVRGTRPILFILDELPRLRRMPPVEEALEIGRQYGIKLWLFTQSLGQLETAYDNAKGMVGSCAVRMFMNPSSADQGAERLSDELGERESVLDGTRVKRVAANVLAGPQFKDRVIVLPTSAEPGSVLKHYAHSDPDFRARMEIPQVMVKTETPDGA